MEPVFAPSADPLLEIDVLAAEMPESTDPLEAQDFSEIEIESLAEDLDVVDSEPSSVSDDNAHVEAGIQVEEISDTISNESVALADDLLDEIELHDLNADAAPAVHAGEELTPPREAVVGGYSGGVYLMSTDNLISLGDLAIPCHGRRIRP